MKRDPLEYCWWALLSMPAGIILACASVVVLFFLTGCATDTMQVVWHKSTDPDRDCRAVVRTPDGFNKYLGCSWKDKGVCHFISRDFTLASERDAMAVVGHELKHCADGQWHPTPVLKTY